MPRKEKVAMTIADKQLNKDECAAEVCEAKVSAKQKRKDKRSQKISNKAELKAKKMRKTSEEKIAERIETSSKRRIKMAENKIKLEAMRIENKKKRNIRAEEEQTANEVSKAHHEKKQEVFFNSKFAKFFRLVNAKITAFSKMVWRGVLWFFMLLLKPICRFFGFVGRAIKSWCGAFRNWYKKLKKSRKILFHSLVSLGWVIIILGLSIGLTLPIKTMETKAEMVLIVGDDYEQGFDLFVTHRSGKRETVSIKDYMIDGLDVTTVGNQSVTIVYKGHKIRANIEVISEDSVKATIREGTLPTTYELNENICTSGILDLWYNEKCFRSVSITPEMVVGFASNLGGKFDATITYKTNIKCTYSYEILKEIASIVASGKVYAEQGVKIAIDNISSAVTLLVTYNDETVETLYFRDDFITCADYIPSETGAPYQEEVDVFSYRGFPFTCLIEAYPKGDRYAVKDLELVLPCTVYKVNEFFDYEQVYLSVQYKYFVGRSRVSLSDSMFMDDLQTVFATPTESVTVGVRYRGVTCSRQIRILSEEEATSVTSLSTNWTGSSVGKVYKGEDLDFTNAELLVTYGYGYASKTVPITAALISGYDKTLAGAQDIAITYEGFEFVKQIIVLSHDNIVTNIEVRNWANITYKTDTEIKIAPDAKLKVEYGYGDITKEIPLTAEMLTDFVVGKEGAQTLIVTYEGCTYDLDIVVYDGTLSALTGVSFLDTGTRYYVGDSFNPDNLKLRLSYAYGKIQKNVTLTEFVALGGKFFADFATSDSLKEINLEEKKTFNESKIYNLAVTIIPGDDPNDCLIARSLLSVNAQTDVTNITSITIDATAGKTIYKLGEAFVKEGLKIIVNYSDGTQSEGDIGSAEIIDFHSGTIGLRYATVQYFGIIGNFSYNVIE